MKFNKILADQKWPVRTAGGMKVRILSTNMKSITPIVGIVTNEDGTESLLLWREDETLPFEDNPNMVLEMDVKEKEGYIVVLFSDYRSEATINQTIYTDKDIAEDVATRNMGEVIKIKYSDFNFQKDKR